MSPTPKGTPTRGVIFGPCSSLQIRNVGRDAGSFNMVVSHCEVVFSEMHLGLDDCELVAEVTESVVLTAELLDFGGGISVVEVGNSVVESVEGGSRAIEEGVEPDGEWFGDVLR
jgi:hypothetical protein